jgi:hypothetical protein
MGLLSQPEAFSEIGRTGECITSSFPKIDDVVDRIFLISFCFAKLMPY